MWEYTYDGIGRRVAKTCSTTTTGEILTTHVGDQLVAEHHIVSDADSDLVGWVWIIDLVTGDIIGQINHTTNTGAGISGGDNDPTMWSQAKVDTVFYSMVADLAGAPQELINPETGTVAGKATHTLYGRRKWDGENTPLLFAGQYEDTETGFVYNRYRYYNPHSGTYTSQDPLGVEPNPATTQGYVINPLIWVDKQGLQAHKVGKGVDPKGPNPNYRGHANDGTFTGENPAANAGRAKHKELSDEILEKENYIINKALPGSEGKGPNGGSLFPDGHKLDKRGFVTDVAEIKPDSSSGRSLMKSQLGGYVDHANSYNAARATGQGVAAPTVRTHQFFILSLGYGRLVHD